MHQLDYTPLFDAALAEPLGLRVKTNNPKSMQQALMNWRKAAGVEAYYTIEICATEAADEVFLLQKSVELEP